jgi:APA family basic amino acid/polyamine antiporter
MAFALAVGIGTTMGGGILYAPGKIAALLPNAWLYMAVWIFGGINALLGATVFAELGAMIPLSGGPYPFARRALGDYAGFFVGYTQWALDCASDAALLLLVGEYAYVLVSSLAGHAVAVAFATLIAMTVLNWHSVRGGGRIQVITTVAKTVALGAVIVAAFIMPQPAAVHGAISLPTPHGIALIAAWMLAMQGVIFAYDSYYVATFFGEELHNPGREIPRAIFRGLAVIIPTYLLLNAAFLRTLPIARMADEPFVGGAAAAVLFGIHGDQIIRVIVIVSLLGTINGTFGAVLGVIALLLAVNYLLMFISLIVLRIREPNTPRPYRAWGYPWTTGIAIFIGLAFIVGVALSDPHHSAIALAILLVSYPLFRGTRRLLQYKP